MKEILKGMIEVYNKKMSSVSDECFASTQIAAAFSPCTYEGIFNIEVNNCETEKCYEYDWQSKIMHSHAEYKLLHINKKEILKMPENSISIIITSHPCDNCINFLTKFEKQIKDIFYINNYAAMNKINSYNLRKNKPKEYKDININFQQYVPEVINDSSGYSEYLKRKLYDDVKKYCIKFVKDAFLDFDNDDKRYLIFTKDEIRMKINKIEVFESFANMRIMRYRKGSIFIDLHKINEWFSSQN